MMTLTVLSLIQFLEEIEQNHQTVTIPPAEVERLLRPPDHEKPKGARDGN